MPTEKLEHLAQYEHEIEVAKRRMIPCLIVVAVGTPILLLGDAWLMAHPSKNVTDDTVYRIALMSLLWVIGIAFLGVVVFGYQQIRQIRLKSVARNYSPMVHARAVNAYNNIKEFLTSPTEQYWRASLLDRLCERYQEFEQIETSELEQRLEAAGVWNTSVKWYGKGRTFDEALMLAVYTGRQSKVEAESKAVGRSQAQTEAEKMRAADLQRRRELELEIAAKQQELERLTNQTVDVMPESVKIKKPAKETGLEGY
jgi:hypothetical protein